MIRIFESLLEESGKKRFIKKWLPNDAEKVEEYDKVYEEFAQVFDSEVKKRGLNWQTSMTLEIFEEILEDVRDRKSKTDLKKQHKSSGKSDFLSYVLANPGCDLTYLGTLCKWDYFKIESWPGAMLADSFMASLNGDTGAQWCIGWKDPELQKFDEYTEDGYDFVLIVKSDNSNTDIEEKYCIQINRYEDMVNLIWTPTDDAIGDEKKIKKILYGQEPAKMVEKRHTRLIKDFDVVIKEQDYESMKKIVNVDNNKNAIIEIYRAGTNQKINPDEITTLEIIDGENYKKLIRSLRLRNVQKIILPYGIKKIDNYLFRQFENLIEVEIPESVEVIGVSSFSNCYSLTSIKLPPNLKAIETSAFHRCKSLRHIEIPDSVIRIDDSAFDDCRSLESIKLSSNLKRLGECVFQSCTSLKQIEIPDFIEEINIVAFFNCKSLEYVKLPPNLKFIGTNAFGECLKLKHIEIPNSVEMINYGAFYNCESLETVKLPHNLKKISQGLFSGCRKLKHVEIPESVQDIDLEAFYNCSELSIKIPDSICYIGVSAFFGCNNIHESEKSKILNFNNSAFD